jgi:trehalose synthase
MGAPPLSGVKLGTLPLERFSSVLSAERYQEVSAGVQRARGVFHERTVWNVSSTARGGGVAEMLTTLLAHARGAGIDARWEVVGGNEDFFALTKRIHNRLHGFAGDGGPLGEAERARYEAALAESGSMLAAKLGPADLVILHDPQTAGLIPAVLARGVPVVWRCHIGIDSPNELARETWRFLAPYVERAHATVFSRSSFVWEGLDRGRVAIITPSLDAFAPKNQDLGEAEVGAILDVAGLVPGAGAGEPLFTAMCGKPALVRRRARVIEQRPLRRGESYVAQISRWDNLKDPRGVVSGFARYVAPHTDAHLVCAGPEVEGVSDDPEGALVLAEVTEQWGRLEEEVRERIHLAVLPMTDTEENAAIVNALQRSASVVVQKSLAEGFGLTVAEAMWKARPVAASRIGGIQDQIEHGRSGLLLDDPSDLELFGAAVRRLLEDPEAAHTMGDAARERVRERFLGPASLLSYLELLSALV